MSKVLEDFAKEFAIDYAKNHVEDYAQDFVNERVLESRIETARALKAEGLSFEMAIRILPGLTVEEIKKIYHHE